MTRRLTADAKIVLEHAGYYVAEIGSKTKRSHFLSVHLGNVEHMRALKIKSGTVDNDEVVKLLNARGLDEFGQRRDCINADDMAEAELNSYGYDPTGPEAGAGFRDYPPDTFDDPTWDWD